MEWETLLRIADNWSPNSKKKLREKLAQRLASIEEDKERIALGKLVAKTIVGYTKMVYEKIELDPEGAKKNSERLFDGCMTMMNLISEYNNFLHYHGQVSVSLPENYFKTIYKKQS